jgi:antitoxin VapB
MIVGSLQKIRLRYKVLYLIPLEFPVMGMNIKSENTHRRAKELARIAGETIAEAVDRAVTERLERLRRRRNRQALAERLLKIGDQCSRLPVLDIRAPDEMLYDERGLPQ